MARLCEKGFLRKHSLICCTWSRNRVSCESDCVKPLILRLETRFLNPVEIGARCQFQLDVLVCNFRMPGGSGYDLIRQIHQLEAKEGGHLLATAITAYQDEDREESLKVGFDTLLYKFAQPNEWVEMIAKLAGQSSA